MVLMSCTCVRTIFEQGLVDFVDDRYANKVTGRDLLREHSVETLRADGRGMFLLFFFRLSGRQCWQPWILSRSENSLARLPGGRCRYWCCWWPGWPGWPTLAWSGRMGKCSDAQCDGSMWDLLICLKTFKNVLFFESFLTSKLVC